MDPVAPALLAALAAEGVSGDGAPGPQASGAAYPALTAAIQRPRREQNGVTASIPQAEHGLHQAWILPVLQRNVQSSGAAQHPQIRAAAQQRERDARTSPMMTGSDTTGTSGIRGVDLMALFSTVYQQSDVLPEDPDL